MKKKLLSLLIVTTMVVSLTACGADETEKPDAASGSAVSEAAAAEEPAPEASEEPAVDEDNMIEDGTFDGDKPWDVYTTSGGSASTSIEEGEMRVSFTDTGDVEHGVQIYYDGFGVNEGTEYEFSFDARSTVDRTVSARLQMNGGDYHPYFREAVDLTSEMKHYSYTFKMKEASDPAPRLCFNMGMQDDGKKYQDHEVYFDNMRFVIKDASGAVAAEEDDDITGIRLNQVGYKPEALKSMVFAGVPSDKTYWIADAKTGEKIKEISFKDGEDEVENPYAEETDRPFAMDDQDLAEKGRYKIIADDGTESPAFKISENVYDDLIKKSVKMLYLQRCGTAIDKKYGGKYAHKKCHDKKATLYWDDSVKLDVSGGWHDAGDYGRYVVSGAKAAADLLLAYDDYKDKKIIDNVGVPHSGDGVDDLLQEVKYELDWMLKMQSENGLVYSKVTCANFPDTVMPEEETQPLIISYTSTPATADFVAVMSLAARVFKGTKSAELKKAADKYLKAAKKSWKYLAKNPKVKGHTNPAGIVTGEYPDTKDRDERLWAAAELYRTTGDKSIIPFIDDCASEVNMTGYGWLDCGGYGCYAALMNKNLKKNASSTYQKVYDGFKNIVSEAADTVSGAPYGINRTDTYEWGSNMGIANDGMMFLMAKKVLKKEDSPGLLQEYAQSQLDYLLGKNPTGYCFVTGFGTKSPKNPHHRPSQVKKKAIPGMLVGGVNNGLDDPYCENVLKKTPAAKCYADVDQSYSTNEVAVYWNSPLVYLLTVI